MSRKLILSLLALVFAVPAGLFADEIAFKKTKQVVQDGDKSKERDVALVFLDDKTVVKHRDAAQTYVEIPNSSITELTYELSKSPRMKAALFVSPLFLFSPGKKHWLTIKYQSGSESAFVLLHLDKKEYQRIIATSETKTGKKVERITED